MRIKKKLFDLFCLATLLSVFGLGRAEAAPGDPDPTFGAGGRVTTGTGSDARGNAVAVQPDGKIVVAGGNEPNGLGFLVRYNADGSLDASFGAGGFVYDGAHGGHPTAFHAVLIQPDGQIVAAGNFSESGGCWGERPWVVRYNPDGSRDTTFGTGGAVEFIYFCDGNYTYGNISAAAIQPDGKILVAGSAENSSGNLDFAAARLNSDGSMDTSFNLDGKATFSIGNGNEQAYSVAIHPVSGKILLAGFSENNSTSKDFALVMLTTAGLYDFGFGTNGKVVTNTGGEDAANAVAFQTDGKIVAAGRQSNGSNGTNFSLARFYAGGALDASFGTSGKVVTAFSASYDAAFGVGLQADGKIVAAGFGADNNALNTGYNFALARYNPNGALDAAFSGDGKQMTDFAGFGDHGQAVAIQPDGKILVVGYASNGNDDIALARYLP